ncbi:hypothetical protein E4U13_006615 [Claviceps humidiphila]|uniref:Uncharacterized protein n=1 Tax=Claviceps humidiphila TaxID=1294629 RepID=A0A9P7Q9G4_9HYPO|nr:hypothetical protein E4U13_006615 [Claviceps humidiphila]
MPSMLKSKPIKLNDKGPNAAQSSNSRRRAGDESTTKVAERHLGFSRSSPALIPLSADVQRVKYTAFSPRLSRGLPAVSTPHVPAACIPPSSSRYCLPDSV